MNTTLLIDGNWLLMSRLFAVKSYFNVQNDDEEKQKGTAELEDLMCRSINIVINKFEKVVDNIIIVADGGSWRKSVEKPDFFEEVYKGNRVKDVEIDWSYVYRSLEDILEKANELGITACKAGEVEGDDWIFHWSRKLNNNGINCIIWSSDADLKQLVQVNNGCFTVWLNESQKGGLPGLIVHKELDDTAIDEIDMFMQVDKSSPTLNEIMAHVNAVTYINPTDIVSTKVICGDKGDNIKSIMQVTKNDRTYSVSEKEWDKIKVDFNIESVSDFLDNKDSICESIVKSKKYSKYNPNLQNLKTMFEYNKVLVWLNEKTIPQYIQDKMNEVEYKKYDLSYIRSNYKMLCKLEAQEKSIDDIFSDIPF